MVTTDPCHLAIAVHDLAAARAFHGDVLGCPEGRSPAQWNDFNLHDHRLVCHLVDGAGSVRTSATNPGDGHAVLVPHVGVVLDMHDWNALAEHLHAAGVPFGIEPHVRFAGQPGEQATMFLLDPSGNALEFKSFADIEGQLFAT